MAGQLAGAISYIIAACPYVVAVHDLVTKTRLELAGSYFLDLYYNATLGKYTYALIHQGRRIYGWDNASHHPGLANHPHHFHDEDGSIRPSSLTGDPEKDVLIVIIQVNTRLREK
jgi:hypothetical protein